MNFFKDMLKKVKGLFVKDEQKSEEGSSCHCPSKTEEMEVVEEVETTEGEVVTPEGEVETFEEVVEEEVK